MKIPKNVITISILSTALVILCAMGICFLLRNDADTAIVQNKALTDNGEYTFTSQATNSEAGVSLNLRQKSIIPIAAFTASGDVARLMNALEKGMDGGLTVNETKEILIHTYAYAGFPRALNGINVYMSILDKRKARGLTDVVGKESSLMSEDFDRSAFGHKVRNYLVGRDMSKPTGGYQLFAPAIDHFLVEHLFADIFYRDILSFQDRELVTISILSVLPGAEPQLKSHLQIAKNMGLTDAQLKEFVFVLKNEVGPEIADRAAAQLGEIIEARTSQKPRASLTIIRNVEPVQAPKEHFTGKVSVGSTFASQYPQSYRGGIVYFEAGARTAWHTHPLGQTLIVISGQGLVQIDGAAAEEIHPGDVVWIPANTRHWHGASFDSAMSHVAISDPLNGSTVQWNEKVKDKEYREIVSVKKRND